MMAPMKVWKKWTRKLMKKVIEDMDKAGPNFAVLSKHMFTHS